MDAQAFIGVYVVTTAIALLVLFLIIRFAVKSGTTAALREHEVWKVDGSMQAAYDARTAEMTAEQARAAHHAAQMRGDHSSV